MQIDKVGIVVAGILCCCGERSGQDHVWNYQGSLIWSWLSILLKFIGSREILWDLNIDWRRVLWIITRTVSQYPIKIIITYDYFNWVFMVLRGRSKLFTPFPPSSTTDIKCCLSFYRRKAVLECFFAAFHNFLVGLSIQIAR